VKNESKFLLKNIHLVGADFRVLRVLSTWGPQCLSFLTVENMCKFAVDQYTDEIKEFEKDPKNFPFELSIETGLKEEDKDYLRMRHVTMKVKNNDLVDQMIDQMILGSFDKIKVIELHEREEGLSEKND